MKESRMSEKKSNRIIRHFIVIPSIWTLLYLAFIVGIEGASNLLHGLAWFMAFSTLFLLSDNMKPHLKERPKDWLCKLDKTSDVLIAFTFIWFGSTATGIAWLIATLIASVAFEAAHEKE
jgi:hypothetical protein